MPVYEVAQYEIHIMKIRVEAKSNAEAIHKVLHGEGEGASVGTEYVSACKTYGMELADHPGLAAELKALGDTFEETFVPSIHSAEEVE